MQFFACSPPWKLPPDESRGLWAFIFHPYMTMVVDIDSAFVFGVDFYPHLIGNFTDMLFSNTFFSLVITFLVRRHGWLVGGR